MTSMFNQFAAGLTAFESPLDARLAFIRRTYLHLVGAVGLFVALSFVLFASGASLAITQWMYGTGYGVIVALVGMVGVSIAASAMAHSAKSSTTQYLGLLLYTLGLSLFVTPILYVAVSLPQFRGHHLLETAAGLTLVTFGGITTLVLTTKKDFSFLAPIVFAALLVAVGVAICGAIFGFTPGLWLTGLLVLVTAGMVLVSTSRVIHDYKLDQHVGAALDLFSSIVMLFLYVLLFLMQMQDRRR